MRHDPATILLYCSVNQQELDLIAASGWLAFPPLRPEPPAFYPVLDEAYAAPIAHDWNGASCGVGYVLRLALNADYAAQLPGQNVGTGQHEELRVPAEELADFNQHIQGRIEIVGIFKP